MWQSGLLHDVLAGTEGAGIRPVIRACMPVALDRLDDMSPRNSHPPSGSCSESRPNQDFAKGMASAAACAALQRLDLAIVLLQSNRRVVLSNPAAMRVAARGDCFRLAARKLHLIDARNQHLLETFLNIQGPKDLALSASLCVSGPGGGGRRYVLFVAWLELPSLHDCHIASLLIYEPQLIGQLSPELLASLYGLTRMESRLVAALFVEPVLQTAADQCGITTNTAKTHLKHVFVKCGVCSKAELLRLLALGPRSI